MANRNWKSGGRVFSMHKDPVMLDCSILIGASGAVTSFTGPTISSVSQSSTGVYVVTFMDNYPGLISAQGSMQSPSSGLSGIGQIEIQNAPNAAVSAFPQGSLTVTCLNNSGAAANPASGSILNLLIVLSNSQANPVQGEA